MKAQIYIDGGCAPTNPGHAGFAAVITFPDRTEGEYVVSRYLGIHTNNYAEYCNPHDALVVMGDFIVSNIGDINIGDLVVGWDTPAEGYRKFVRSEVIAKKERRTDTVVVELESGNEVVCTPGHKWAQPEWLSSRGRIVYRPAEVGRCIYRVIKDVNDLQPPYSRELAYWCGWLGGMYDGEGCRNTIAQWRETNPEQHDRLGTALEKLGFQFSFDNKGYAILGGKDELMRFAAWCRPSKLITNDYWIKSFNGNPSGCMTANMTMDRVLAIRPAGKRDVVSLQTESGNYNAWGLASKNCGLIVGAKYAHELGATAAEIYSDSKLIVNQTNGVWKVKSADMRPLNMEARRILDKNFGENWNLHWIPRAQNAYADDFCTLAINAGRNANPWLRRKLIAKIIDPFSRD